MTIDPDLVEYLRTLIRDDHDTNRLVEERLDAKGWGADFTRLLSAAFFYAIDLRFGEQVDRGAVVRFVADMRTDSPDIASAVDPATAEAAILAVLDPDLPAGTDPEALAKIQTFTIYKILTEAGLNDTELNRLLAEAAQLAGSAPSH